MKMIKGEFKFIFHNKLIMLSTIVIMIIPFLYSIFFLKSVWDPYGNTGDLPVAVVNNDQPVKYEGKTMNVGKQTVQELKKNKQLGWRFVSKQKAQAGLKQRKYYTVVTIPKDFSKNATTVMSTTPKKMHLTYKTNDSLNYIGEVISEMGAKQLNTQIREQVTKAYATAVFTQLKTVGTGMKSAAKAETKLHDGTVTLNDGLNTYAVGVNQVNTGVQTLKVSVVPLSNGISQLANGGGTLATALQSYTGGVGQVNNGLQQLTANSGALVSGTQQAGLGIDQLQNGNSQITAKLKEVSQQIDTTLTPQNQQELQQFTNTLTELSSVLNSISGPTGTNLEVQLQSDLTGVGTNTAAVGKLATESGANFKDVYSKVFDTGNQNSTAVQLSKADANTKALQTILDSDAYKQMASNDQTTAAKVTAEVGSIQGNITTAKSSLVSAGTSVAGLNTSLSNMSQPLNDSKTKLKDVNNQIGQILPVLNSLKEQQADNPNGMADGIQAINQLESGLLTINTGLKQVGSTANTMGFIQASETVGSGLTQLQAGISGQNGLINGVSAYTNGVSQAQSGTQQLTNNSSELTSGATQLNSGLGQLNSQVPTLTNGVNQLANGTQQLADNSGRLINGTSQLANGSGQLQDALTNGSNQVNSIKPTSKTADMFAAPADLNHKSYSYVPNYGHALAPYVLSVALFVGSLVFNFAYPIRKVAMLGRTPKEWFASKVTVGGIVAIGMAVIETGLMLVAGLDADHPAQMFFIAIMFSLASMYIVMFLSMTFDNPGRFVAMVLLMLQLGGSGGTFPMEVTNSFFNAIHPWLPMTYSIMGFREALTSGLGSQVVWQAAGVLLIFALLGLALLLPSMILLQKLHWHGKSQLDNNQQLQGLEK
ncbi:phage infection protein [Paucilactobacillus hokkaidonensis JCM 18461]|uniref:Phage infection protein n=1 Tax=Paucilactobacillus hokkaidonensis JCM 18461 TaxID=1291742 RepID=A0A0A1GY08_9LACO|nr:phage infection protein [Paucilactobacillus hokkaidonensis JCM 18461]